MFHLIKIVKVSEKTGQLRRNYRPAGVVFQLALLSILLPLRSRGTTDNYSVELITKTHGFIRHTELRTWREAGITAKTFMKK